jgi:glycerol-3-phosphate acyltransferase PlsY
LWILIVGFWRYSSLGSVVAAATIPIFVYFLYAPRFAPPGAVTFGTIAISVIVLLKHRANIGRLATGTENKMYFRR